MYFFRKNKVSIAIVAIAISTATVFFSVAQTTIMSKKEVNRVSSIPGSYKTNHETMKWNGYKWYAEQTARLTSKENNSERNKGNIEVDETTSTEAVMVNVLIEEDNTIESIMLEDYVLAVALKEIPWNFQDEAIKAQMIAARTYIMYRLNQRDSSDRQYDVTNSTRHQVFDKIDETMLSEQQKLRYEQLKALLATTKGKVLTYDGELIDALYFSTSNGKTEAGRDYFGTEYPYLQSVSSKWDTVISTSYEKQFEFSYSEFLSRLQKASLLDKQQKDKDIKINLIARTDSNRIKTLKVNNSLMTAKQFREALGIASTDFTWSLDNKNSMITIHTKGYGHGVGMSQWGAEGMAREGYNYEQILNHYYTKIEIESL